MTVDMIQTPETDIELMPGEWTIVGWDCKEKLEFDDWAEIGQRLAYARQSISWWVGDWINYGESRYGEKYAQALDATTFVLGTLQNDVYTSSRIPLQYRNPRLSWTHHFYVAPYDLEIAKRFLAMADRHNWSTRQLKRAKRLYKAIKGEIVQRGKTISPNTVSVTSYLPLPPMDVIEDNVRQAYPGLNGDERKDVARFVVQQYDPDSTIINWKAVAKTYWSRYRGWRRLAERLEDILIETREENTRLFGQLQEAQFELARQDDPQKIRATLDSVL